MLQHPVGERGGRRKEGKRKESQLSTDQVQLSTGRATHARKEPCSQSIACQIHSNFFLPSARIAISSHSQPARALEPKVGEVEIRHINCMDMDWAKCTCCNQLQSCKLHLLCAVLRGS